MRSRLGFGLLANTVALFCLGAPPQQNTHQKQKLVVLIWMESSFAVNHALDRFFFFDSLGIFSHLMGSLIKNRWQNHQYSNSIMNISPTFPKEKGGGGGKNLYVKWISGNYSAMEIHEVPLRIRVRLSRLKFGSWFLPKEENQIQKENIWECKGEATKNSTTWDTRFVNTKRTTAMGTKSSHLLCNSILWTNSEHVRPTKV